MEIKNILISNVYSWKNKGDAAIVMCMMDDIRKQFPNAKITISSHDSEDKGKYGEDDFELNVERYVFKSHNKLIKILELMCFIVKIAFFRSFLVKKQISKLLFGSLFSKKINSYSNFDLIIACGGGYLLAKSWRSIFRLIPFCYDFYFAKLFKKPYIMYNQSIGPFNNKLDRLIIKHYIENAKLIICRENITFQRLKSMNLQNLLLSNDVAFNLSPSPTQVLNSYYYDSSKMNVGITVRSWFSDKRQNQYEKSIANFIEDSSSLNFYFIPQVIYKIGGDDDLITANRIFKLLSEDARKRVNIICEDISPSQIKYVISKMNYFVGTRMHSNIFALGAGIKTIAISYEPKTRGIMQTLGLEEYVIEMTDIDTANLSVLFTRLVKDNNYFKRIENIKTVYTNLKSYLE
ncbi:polysaccharide pyruvyl transferase family protein [Candidatus Woesearchaeota archaeon]|nr:polysaccharide pyruvyl transferase family protein [Candidatus Woesearchaeota archaeon]